MAEELLFDILRIDAKSARLEGAFSADPEIGSMWRAQAALTEACRSVGLEDIHVFEGDVIYRHLENRQTSVEQARGAFCVAELMKVIVQPGDILEDPVRVLDRCWRAATAVEDGAPPFDAEEISARIVKELQNAPTIFLGALKAAIRFRAFTEAAAPSADRLVFMAADHALRGAGQVRRYEEDGPEAILRKLDANWVLLPSTALTQGRFRAWSPVSSQGMADLMEGMNRDMDRALGHLPLLRRWREQAREISGAKHGKSRLRDLVELIMVDPLLTAPHVRARLGISERASLYIMKEAEEAGILTCITPRKSYRVWAQPQLAENLRARATRRSSSLDDRVRRTREEAGQDGDVSITRFDPIDPEAQAAREEKVMSDLDAALAGAEAVLARYRERGNS